MSGDCPPRPWQRAPWSPTARRRRCERNCSMTRGPRPRPMSSSLADEEVCTGESGLHPDDCTPFSGWSVDQIRLDHSDRVAVDDDDVLGRRGPAGGASPSPHRSGRSTTRETCGRPKPFTQDRQIALLERTELDHVRRKACPDGRQRVQLPPPAARGIRRGRWTVAAPSARPRRNDPARRTSGPRGGVERLPHETTRPRATAAAETTLTRVNRRRDPPPPSIAPELPAQQDEERIRPRDVADGGRERNPPDAEAVERIVENPVQEQVAERDLRSAASSTGG